MDNLLKTKEVAEWLNITPHTVRKLWKSGKLPAVKLSEKALRFKTADIEKFLKNNDGN